MTLTPLQVVRRVSTTVDQIYADVHARFINAHYDILPEERRGRRRTHTALLLDGLRIDHFESAGGQLSAVGGDYYHLGFVAQGSYLVKRPKFEYHNNVGGMGSIDLPGRKFSFQSAARSQGFIVCLPPEVLLRSGRALLGDNFRLPEDLQIDLRSKAGEALRRNVSSIFFELTELEKIGLGRLAMVSFSELIANLSIASMYPEHFLTENQKHEASSRTVARAEEMIRARCHEAVSIKEVASALGVTVRSLQLGFRKHLGCSPLQYLLARRLELVRQRLQNPETALNVQFTAMSCGFMNMSKFSSRYRAMFGELPSETLARGRRR